MWINCSEILQLGMFKASQIYREFCTELEVHPSVYSCRVTTLVSSLENLTHICQIQIYGLALSEYSYTQIYVSCESISSCGNKSEI